jgi:hypothetical protein
MPRYKGDKNSARLSGGPIISDLEAMHLNYLEARVHTGAHSNAFDNTSLLSKIFRLRWTPNLAYKQFREVNRTVTAKLVAAKKKDKWTMRSLRAIYGLYRWYNRYANLRFDDALNLERIQLFIDQKKFDRPNPVYLALYPPLKAIVSQAIVYALILPVEAVGLLYSLGDAIDKRKGMIFAQKLVNTVSVILNKGLVLPDLFGLLRGIYMTRDFLRERVVDGGRVSRGSYLIESSTSAFSSNLHMRANQLRQKIRKKEGGINAPSPEIIHSPRDRETASPVDTVRETASPRGTPADTPVSPPTPPSKMKSDVSRRDLDIV